MDLQRQHLADGPAAEAEHAFRPEAPGDWVLHVPKRDPKQSKYAWLSNFDIDAVMAQYEDLRTLRDFKFYRAVSIDFEATRDPLSRANLYGLLAAGIEHFAVVFNTDPHDKPGSHWVCLYCNMKTGIICFYDSYGRLPEPEFQDFMAKMVAQGLLGFDGETADASRAIELSPLYNDRRHQYMGAECGMYSLDTIISMLLSKGRSRSDFEYLCAHPHSDEQVNSFRKNLYIDGGGA